MKLTLLHQCGAADACSVEYDGSVWFLRQGDSEGAPEIALDENSMLALCEWLGQLCQFEARSQDEDPFQAVKETKVAIMRKSPRGVPDQASLMAALEEDPSGECWAVAFLEQMGKQVRFDMPEAPYLFALVLGGTRWKNVLDGMWKQAVLYQGEC